MLGTLALILAIIVWLQLRDLRAHVRSLRAHRDEDSTLRRRLLRLEQRIQSLELGTGTPGESGARALERPTPPPPDRLAGVGASVVEPEDAEPTTPTVDAAPPLTPEALLRELASRPAPPSPVRRPPATRAATEAPSPRREPSAFARRWQALERQIIENWTGVLGAAVLVAGITFIGGYAGLRLPPVFRSLMIAAAAGVLAIGSRLLARHAQWTLLADWLRSTAAAVFLLACFGSSALPALRWIETLTAALGLLVLGLAVNLAVAFVATRASIASLHVVLSVIPLTLVPQSFTTLVLATAVGSGGAVIGYRNRWTLHTALTLTAFSVFHVIWYLSDFAASPGTGLRLAGVGSVLLVTAIVAWSHFREGAPEARGTIGREAAHLANWSVLAIAVAIYSGTPAARGTALLGLAVVVFVLARRARSLGLRRAFLMDTLVTQALALLGLVAYFPVAAHWMMIPGAATLLGALFLRLAIDADEALLERVAVHLLHATMGVCAFGGLTLVAADRAVREQNALILFAVAIVGTAAHLYLRRVRGEPFDSLRLYGDASPGVAGEVSLLAVAVGATVAMALANLLTGPYMEPAAFAAVTGLLLLSRRSGSVGLRVATWLSLVPAHLLSWSYLLGEHPLAPASQVSRLAPLAAATFAILVLVPPGPVRRLLRHTGVYLLAVHFGVATYVGLEPLSPLAPAIGWLVLSLIAVEIANRIEDPVTPLVLAGYGYLAAFTAAYAVVILPTEAYWGPIPVRVVVEAFAVGTGAFWWRYRPRDQLRDLTAWRVVHPVFLELVLLLGTVIAFVEVDAAVRPLVWIGLALACGSGPLRRLDPRFAFYSVLLYWASGLDMVVVTSALVTPSAAWYEHPMTIGLATMVLQVVYLARTARRLVLHDLPFPPLLAILDGLAGRVGQRQSLWMYYPFFVGGALFLYWRFDGAVLTLLWAFEAFCVFVLSLALRERHFRYMAMAGLGAALLRLIVYDMAQTNLGVRGLVFMGVGLLMLGMHSLYNRYRDRFE